MPSQPLDEKAVFNVARTIGQPEARAAYLEQVCIDDSGLRQRVEALLQGLEKQESFLESPAPFANTITPNPVTEQPGDTIGPYKLLQQIGEGGMGVVYMAEQTEPVERRVALKIIKPGMDSRQVISRFEAERQALAMMDHPNIARVLDAGTTETGRPYFVMELVKGIPVTKYCDQEHLSVRERLELFVPICQAIQHAHQKGIIHRDVKPTNILVARYDGKPMPKVIDFGVAKATSQRLTEKTMFTQYGQIVGTIEYMSPEQAEFNQLDIDTRSDIYSLGVLLYELLTGETPFDKDRLRSAAFDELLRIIREEEPPRPSTRVSCSATLPSVAAKRRTEPGKLGALVRGELDWIVMRALDKDRSRRYETASRLAEDIQHYLHDEAVSACPPSASYRFRKFARRHKAAMTTTAAVLLALIAGIIGTTWQAIRATRSEAFAREQEQIAISQKAVIEQTAEQERSLRIEAEQERERSEMIAQNGMRLFEGMLDDVIRLNGAEDGDASSIGIRFFDGPAVAGQYFYLAQIELELNRPQAAISYLTTAIDANPDFAQLYMLRGYAHQSANDLKSAEHDYNEAFRIRQERFTFPQAYLGDGQLAQLLHDPLLTGDSPFSPLRADVSFGSAQNAAVWRPRCGNLVCDDILMGGYQKPSGNRCFLAEGAAHIREQILPGLLMVNCWKDDGPLMARWTVRCPSGTTFRLECGLTDGAVRGLTSEVRIAMHAVDAEGKTRTLFERHFEPGDDGVYRTEVVFEAPIQVIELSHDIIEDGSFQRVWIRPELVPPDRPG